MSDPQPIVVIGASVGGFEAVSQVLQPLPTDYPFPILVVQHMLAKQESAYVELLSKKTLLKVQFAVNGYKPEAGYVYVAPPNYHVRLEQDGYMMLSNDEKVRFSRPSIDVLFQSVANQQFDVIAVVLSGSNKDGVDGALKITQNKGVLIVQLPETAESPIMPQAVIDACPVDYCARLDQIGPILWDLSRNA